MTEVDDSMRLVMERVYAHWHDHGEWPERKPLQRQFAAEGLDVDPGWLEGSGREYAFTRSPEDRVHLTLRGLSLVESARPLLEAYLRALHVMHDRYRTLDDDARFSVKDLGALSLDPITERELLDLLQNDHWGQGGSGDDADGWSCEITDQIRRVDGIDNVEKLLAMRLKRTAEGDQPPAPPGPEPLRPAQGTKPSMSTDRPIATDAEDLLNRQQLTQVLAAQATEKLEQGFVMGVVGPWGSGKTSLLNLMAATIEEGQSGHVAHFDPWLFSSSEELVLRFLREIHAQLWNGGQRGEAAMQIAKYAEAIAPLPTLAHAPWLAASMMASSRLVQLRGKRKASLSAREQRKKVAEALSALDRRLVVVIDDLDRLTAAEIRDVVRLVKLVADFPNTTYVLAYDRQRVACALGDGDEREGHEYLEKIVQLTFEVPPANSVSLSQILSRAISEAIGDLTRYRFDMPSYESLFAYAQGLFRNVRDIRQFANALPGTLALTGREVELADILAIEALRTRVPASFALLVAARHTLTRTSGELTRRADAEAARQVEAIVTAAGSFADDVTEIIKGLFPGAARHLGGTGYGREWLGRWREAGRIAHPEVLDIYLSKALPPGALATDLVDRAVEAFQDEQELTTSLAGLESEQLEMLLKRLENREDEFPATNLEIPVAALFNEHRRLQRPKQHALDLGARNSVPRVVLRLLRRQNQDEVARIVAAALPRIRTLSERRRLLLMVGHRENVGHELVNAQAAKVFEDEFIGEIIRADAPTLATEADILGLLLLAQHGRPEEAGARVEHLIADDDLLLALLQAAVKEVVAQAIGDAAVSRSEQLEWTTLTTLVDESLLIARIRQLDDPTIWSRITQRAARALRLALEHVDRPDISE